MTVAFWLQAVSASSLPAPVLAALKEAGVPPEAVAVTVQEVAARKARLSWNAGRPMNPASVMKLLTTQAALELLGPAYTWRTEVWITGTLAGGVLNGDLYLKGGGDPALPIERFELLLRELRARGLSDIRGDLVLDRSRFRQETGDPGAFDGDALAPYNTLPDALILNFQALRLTLVPGAKDVALLPMPELEGVKFVNRIAPASGPCGQWDDGLQAEWQAAATTWIFSGNYPVACGEHTWNLAPADPADYLYRSFQPLWRQLGGNFTGRLRQGPVPTEARLFAGTVSPPLSGVIRDINKFSNNLMARQLFLTLGAERLEGKRPATEADGEAALRAWLAEKKLAMPELVLENGSGLSRQERISAGSLNRLLLFAWTRPFMPEYLSSLPIVAMDGTMRRRLPDTGVAGRAHIKSGSLAEVKSIAGYVTAQDGRRYCVVFIANHAKAANTRPAQDALLQWVWAGAR